MQALIPLTLGPSDLPETPPGVLCAAKLYLPLTRTRLLGTVIETTRGLNITQRDDAMYDGILMY